MICTGLEEQGKGSRLQTTGRPYTVKVAIMVFDSMVYGPRVAAILALDSDGHRLMPLALGNCSSKEAEGLLQAAGAPGLFPQSRAPEAAFAGLWLYFSCRDAAHEIAQNIEGPEGSWWHGIVHRQEPDAGNSSYWFRQVGQHPLFPRLHTAAAEFGVDFGPRWDPFAFIDLCEKARQQPGSALENHALRVQLAEWQLLFDYCAGR
jgi:hypothetical protein